MNADRNINDVRRVGPVLLNDACKATTAEQAVFSQKCMF